MQWQGWKHYEEAHDYDCIESKINYWWKMIKWKKLLSRKDSEGQGINNTQYRKCYEYAIDSNHQDKYDKNEDIHNKWN